MSGKPLPIEQILTMLAEAPPRIAETTAGLTLAQLQTRPAPEEWSVNEVLAHLRACADMWGNAIAKIIAEDKPTFKAVNPRTWITQTNYLEMDFQPSFEVFIKQRDELLAVLRALPPESWSRSATVTGAGKPLQRTLHYYAESIVIHERPHLKQIKSIVDTVQN